MKPIAAPMICLLAAAAFLTPRAVASDARTAATGLNAPANRTMTGLVWMVGKNSGEYWEIWDGNGRDPVICQWLLDEIAKARIALPRNEK